MNRQQLFDLYKKEIGVDFSRNRGVISYLAGLEPDKFHPNAGSSVKALYQAFTPHTNDITAMAAAIHCANKYHNAGQIAGFGLYFQHSSGIRLTGLGDRSKFERNYLTPQHQLQEILTNSEQAYKTLQAIKPETLEKYRMVIRTTTRFRAREEETCLKSSSQLGSTGDSVQAVR